LGFLNLTLSGACMNIIIHSHHVEVTPAIKLHLEEKIKVIKKHFEKIIQVNASLTVDKAHEKELRQKAELSIHAMGKDFFAQAHDVDLYQAIDQAAIKLDKQILKIKEKTKNHHFGDINPLNSDATLG